MSGEESGPPAAVEPQQGGSEGDDRNLDDFVDAMEDPETIRRRGEDETEQHDDAYYDALAERHADQIEDEMEGLREQGIDVDGTGGADTRPYISRSPVLYVPKAEREAAGFVVGPGGAASADQSGARAPETAPVADQGPDARVADPGASVGATPADAGADDGTVARLLEVHVAGMQALVDAVETAVLEIKAVVPQFGSGDLGALTQAMGDLQEFQRIQKSDADRKAETRRVRWRWPLRAVAGVVAAALLVGGAAVQSRWTVLDDGTNGWKDIVWKRHGMKVAECIEAAAKRGKGAVCGVAARVR